MKMENRLWLVLLILAVLAGCAPPEQKPKISVFEIDLPVPWARAPLPPI